MDEDENREFWSYEKKSLRVKTRETEGWRERESVCVGEKESERERFDD